MCGIVGALSFNGNGFRVTEPYVTKMREMVVHRGPDGGDTWVDDDGRIGLGLRRAVDHRPLRRGQAADGQRGRLDPAASSTARSTTTPRSAPSSRRSAATPGGPTTRTPR